MQIGSSSNGLKFLRLNPHWLVCGVFALGGTLCGLLANFAEGYEGVVIFGVFLFVIFLLALWYALYLRRQSRELAFRKREFPNQPWKWKTEWQGQPFEANTWDVMATLWFFSLSVLAISAAGAWITASGPYAKEIPSGIYVFAAVGFALMGGACYQTVRWRKFGRTRFVPASMPGVIGGYLGGVIAIPNLMIPAEQAQLTLKCVRRETRGVGKYRRTTDNVLWEYSIDVSQDKWETRLGGTQIPVLIYIPVGCSDTDDRDLSNEVMWTLSVEAAVPGVDFAAQFVVPVFATGETAPSPVAG